MTPPISIFIQGHFDKELVLKAMSSTLGTTATPRHLDTGTIYECTVMQVDWVLITEAYLEDDASLSFSNYPYEIDLIPHKSHTGDQYYENFYKACALFSASHLSSILDCKVIVVANLQRLIASFP